MRLLKMSEKNGNDILEGTLFKRLRRSLSATENTFDLRHRKSTPTLAELKNGNSQKEIFDLPKFLENSANNKTEKKVRYRRTQSVTRAEEITTKEEKQRQKQPDKPCHRPRDSLFSWSSGFSNFTGLVNWGFLLLSIGGFRLCLENLNKYGIRINPLEWYYILCGKQEQGHASFFLILYSIVHISICLFIEKALAKELISENFGVCVQVINIGVVALIPIVAIYLKGAMFSLLGGSVLCFYYAILFLKLWSYVQTNLWCRQPYLYQSPKRRPSITLAEIKNGCLNQEQDEAVSKLVEYPDNLCYRDICYFLCAPTLCYELNFPRTTRIRKRFLLKRLLEVIIGINVVLALFQQWIAPSVRNSLIPFSNMDISRATERLLKLAFPNHLVWLCFFYLCFHSFLNLLGELLHFADRNFYSDWWNSTNIDIFWRTWNMPVHRWCVRHLYIPVVKMGYSSGQASLLVFLISAFFHEYLVSVPLQTHKIWAFLGMMGQIPLSSLSKRIERKLGPRMGNIIVWASIILGQPLCIMMYYHDYVITHYKDVFNGTVHGNY